MGETNFRTREIPQSGLQAKERKEEKRPKVGDNNSQATHGARKPPGPKTSCNGIHFNKIDVGDILLKKYFRFFLYFPPLISHVTFLIE